MYELARSDVPQEKMETIQFEDGKSADAYLSDTDIDGIPSRIIENVVSEDNKVGDVIKNEISSDIMSKTNNRKQLGVNNEYIAKEVVDKAARQLGTTTAQKGNLTVINKPKTNKNIDPAKGAFIAYDAIKTGMSEDEVNEKFKSYGYTDEDIIEVNKRLGVITGAVESGMPLQDIKQRMSSKITSSNVQPKAIEEKDEFKELSAPELVKALTTLKPVMTSDAMTTLPAFFGSKNAQQRYDAARTQSRERIISLAKDQYGLDLVWQGEGVGFESWYAKTEDGLVEVTPSFMTEAASLAGEVAGGMAGGIAGASYGARLGAAAGTAVGGPAGTAVGGALGFALGGMLGGMLGDVTVNNAQYMYQAMKINADMEAEAMAYRSLNAMEMAAVGEIAGYSVFKTLGVGWKGVVAAKDYLLKGNDQAAAKALKEVFNMTDEDVAELTTQFLKYNESSGSQVGDAINAVVNSSDVPTDLAEKAAQVNPNVSARLSKAVTNRSEELLAKIDGLSSSEAPRFFINDLANYTADVKQQYANVKAIAAESSKNSNFTWDYNKLAIVPTLEDLSSKIVDPSTKERFLLQLDRVRKLTLGKAKRKSVLSELPGKAGKKEQLVISADRKRGFADLLELRQLTNDFLYNKNVTKYDDVKAVRGILDNIDNIIEEAAPEVVDDGKVWLKDWHKARADYSKMKQVEKSAMYRTILDKNGNVKPVQPDTVVKALSKYITALDGSFDEVMSMLPKESRGMYENTVVGHLAKKHTVADGKISATDFHSLATELDKVNFTDAEARSIKTLVKEYSEVFKNDMQLMSMNSGLSTPVFKSYLTTNPIVRLKFETASVMFNAIRAKLPTQSGRVSALVTKSAEVLENPLKQKPFKELVEQFKYEPEALDALNKLRQQTAREAAKGYDKSANMVKIYEGGKLKGSKVIKEIPKHRIVSLEQAKSIADAEAITLDSKSLDNMLSKYGYKAILNSNDRVKLIGK